MAAPKKKRGAARKQPPRSSFRAKKKAKPKPKPKKKTAKKQATRKPKPAPIASTATLLGEITVPSGKLAVFDVGLVGYLPREALEPAIVKADVPSDRPLRVVGTLVGKGRFAD